VKTKTQRSLSPLLSPLLYPVYRSNWDDCRSSMKSINSQILDPHLPPCSEFRSASYKNTPNSTLSTIQHTQKIKKKNPCFQHIAPTLQKNMKTEPKKTAYFHQKPYINPQRQIKPTKTTTRY